MSDIPTIAFSSLPVTTEIADNYQFILIAADLTEYRITGAQVKSLLGGDSISAGSGITITGNDVKSIAVTNPFTDVDEAKLDAIPAVPANESTAKKYELNVPASSGNATWTEVAGEADDGVPDAPANESTAKKYELNVPANSGSATWVESSDVDTTYSAGTGLSLSGTEFSVTNPFTDADESKLDGIEAGAQVNPARAGAFTAADEAKLDGIATGAQVNPKHIESFRTLDNNGAIAGAVYFIKADNTEWQSGSTNDIAAIEVHPTQLTLSQNPQVDTAGYTGWHSLPDDIVINKGSTIWSFYEMGSGTNVPSSPTFQLQAERIIQNSDGNYVLQALTVLEGYNRTGSAGVNWQVSLVFAPPSGADAIIGKIRWSKLDGVPVASWHVYGC